MDRVEPLVEGGRRCAARRGSRVDLKVAAMDEHVALGQPQARRRIFTRICTRRALARTEQRRVSDCPVVPFWWFSNLVAQMGQDFKSDCRYSPIALRLVYGMWEQYTLDLLKDANQIAIGSRRTVVPRSISQQPRAHRKVWWH